MEMFNVNEEFRSKVTHNFRLYILIISPIVHWSESRILEMIWELDGYKCHKTAKYSKISSHIYVKFEDEYSAEMAVRTLNETSVDLKAILAEQMLIGWLQHEFSNSDPSKWTLTIVDIVGDPPFSLNFLTSNIVNSIFADFGGPYLMPYTAALNEPHVQVLFASMTEALAACMAFGEWYRMNIKMDSFTYRVRINPSHREARLIKNCGGTPKEAFKLDYFVRGNIFRDFGNNGGDTRYGKVSKNKMGPNSKGTHNARKQTPFHSNAELPNVLLNQLSNNTPILCLPIIAPLGKYKKGMAAGTNSRLNSDFSTAVLSLQQTLAVASQSKVNSETEISYAAVASKSSECSIVEKLEQSAKNSEKVAFKDITPSGSEDIILNCPPAQKARKTSMKTKSIYRSKRVFERRS